MRCFIVVGMPLAGKNIARTFAQTKNIPYFATGDIVRREREKRGIEPTPESMAALSTELRGHDGLGVTRLALQAAVDSGSDAVFLEGMRSWPEIELIRKDLPSALVIAFVAPRQTRRQRIAHRGRADDSAQVFDERDFREIEYGSAIPLAMADEYVLNTGTEEDALKRLDEILRTYGKG